MRRLLCFFQRKNQLEEEQEEMQRCSTLRSVQGTVTYSCDAYGWINESIMFKPDMVIDDLPLKVGQKVNAVVEENQACQILKIIDVKAVPDSSFDDTVPSDVKTTVIVNCVTSVTEDAIHVNSETAFSRNLLSGGFVPFQGDLIEVEYSIDPLTSILKVHTLSCRNKMNLNELSITSIDGRTGVVEENFFFTLDSLNLPSGYTPHLHDVVNVVAVESFQSHYCWRATSITPAN